MTLPLNSRSFLAIKNRELEDPFPFEITEQDQQVIVWASEPHANDTVIENYFRNLFEYRHGEWATILSGEIACHRTVLDRLTKCYTRMRERLKEVDPEIYEPGIGLPQGKKAWVAFSLGLLAMVIAVSAWVNIARFAVLETESWITAFLYSAPFLFTPLLGKFLYTKLQGVTRQIVSLALILSGLIFFLTLAATFTLSFGYSPSADEIAANPSLASRATDLRFQLFAQIMLDPLLALGAYLWVRDSLRRGLFGHANPDFQRLTEEAARLEGQIAAASASLEAARGLLNQWSKAKEIWVQKANASAASLRAIHQEELRDQAERSADFERRRQERTHRLAQWTASSYAPKSTTNLKRAA